MVEKWIEKWICFTDIIMRTADGKERSLNRIFKVGEIYEFIVERDRWSLHVFIHDNTYFFDIIEIEEFFIPLSEWREQRISKLLEND